MPQQERTNIAVFIDFDNIEIGVKSTLGEHFDIGIILEALKERGEVVTKIAYADWTRAGEYSRALTQHAIRLVQRNLTPGGDKNGADINLALDALEMVFTHSHINAYVIVGGDSDFLSLVEKLKQYDKKVFVVGGRAFTSIILQRNCHEFIAYENLVRKPAVRGGRPAAPTTALPLSQAFPLVRRAVKILADREVSPQTGLLKSTLLQLDSTFSERNYGASSFLDFAEKLAEANLVQLKHAGRSVMVELNPDFSDDSEAASARTEAVDLRSRSPIVAVPAAQASKPADGAAPADRSPEQPVDQSAGSAADGVAHARRLLAAATTARWPMYLRNIKQILRAGSFDERRYGFSGLMDVLRACQREGLIRLERDRRGGLRIFHGTALAEGGATPVDPGNQMPDETSTEEGQMEAALAPEPDADFPGMDADHQPAALVDATAELLGRAKPKRARSRTPVARKTSGKKTGGETGRRGPRRSTKRAGVASDARGTKDDSSD